MTDLAARMVVEVECNKTFKGPPGDPTVKTYSMVELQRAIAAVAGRRQRLAKAVEALAKARERLDKKPTKSAEVAVACGQLAVDNAKKWLDFTIKRYEIYRDLLKEKGSPKTKALLADAEKWADKLVAGARAHHAAVSADGSIDKGAEVPPLPPALRYDYKKNKLLGPDGKPLDLASGIEIPEAGAAPAGEPEGPKEEPAEKPAEAPAEKPEDPGVSPDDFLGLREAVRAYVTTAAGYEEVKGNIKTALLSGKVPKIGVAGTASMLGALLESVLPPYFDVKTLTQKQRVSLASDVMDELMLRADKQHPSGDMLAETTRVATRFMKAYAPPVKSAIFATIANTFLLAHGVNVALMGNNYPVLVAQLEAAVKLRTISGPSDVTKNPIVIPIVEKAPKDPEGMAKYFDEQNEVGDFHFTSGFVDYLVKHGTGAGGLDAAAKQILDNVSPKVGWSLVISEKGALGDALWSYWGKITAQKLAKSEVRQAISDRVKGLLKSGKLLKSDLYPEVKPLIAYPMLFSEAGEGGIKGVYALSIPEAAKSFAEANKAFEALNHAIALGYAHYSADAKKEEPKKPTSPAEKIAPSPVAPASNVDAILTIGTRSLKQKWPALKKRLRLKDLHEKSRVRALLTRHVINIASAYIDAKGAVDTDKIAAVVRKRLRNDLKVLGVTQVPAAVVREVVDGVVADLKTNGLPGERLLLEEIRVALMSAGGAEANWIYGGAGQILAAGPKPLGTTAPPFSHFASKAERDNFLARANKALLQEHGYSLDDLAEKLLSRYDDKTIENLKEAGKAKKKLLDFILGTQQPIPSLSPEEKEAAAKGDHSIKTLFGLDKQAIADALNPETIPPVPAMPPRSLWKGKPATTGSHGAVFGRAGADGKIDPKGGYYWMAKSAPAGFVAAEVAANRVQKLLGLSASPTWVKKDSHGNAEFMSFFKARPNLRALEGGMHTYPWKNSYANTETIKDLQRIHILNYLIDDHDDHGGNLVLDQNTGRLEAIDHGQVFKFFDSTTTLAKELTWEPPPGAGFHDSGKGVPRKTLLAWAQGEDVPITPISDPDIVALIERAEAIPDDVWKDTWRPYAEEAAKRGSLGKFSKNPADKTVEGFLESVNARRKNLRNQVFEAYAKLAAQRAKVVSETTGVAYDKALLEATEQLGLLKFGAAAKVGSLKAKLKELKKAQKGSKGAVEEGKWSGDWRDKNLPQTSRLPSITNMEKAGVFKTEFMVPSTDIKHGKVSVYRMGEGKYAVQFWLRHSARLRLQARAGLAGADSLVPPKPEPPKLLPTDPHVLLSEVDYESPLVRVAELVNKATGPSSYQKYSRAAKYLDKYVKDIGGSTGGKHLYKMHVTLTKLVDEASSAAEAAVANYMRNLLLKAGEALPKSEEFVLAPTKHAAAKKAAEQLRDLLLNPAEVKLDSLPLPVKKKIEKQIKSVDKKIKALAEMNAEENKKRQAAYKKQLAEWEATVAANDSTIPLEGTATDALYPKIENGEWTGEFGFGALHNRVTRFDLDHEGKKTVVIFNNDRHDEATPAYVGPAGLVTAYFDDVKNDDQMAERMTHLANTLGVDLRPANREEQELTYLRRMAWLNRLYGYKTERSRNVEPPGSTRDKINYWIDVYRKEFGSDPRFVKMGGKTVPNPNYRPEAVYIGGRVSFWRHDADIEAIKKLKQNETRLTRSATTNLTSLMLADRHYLPTEARAAIRSISGGLSEASDRAKGGSYEAYFTLRSKDASDYNSGGASLDIDPIALGLTDTWMANGDIYGSKTRPENKVGRFDERVATFAAVMEIAGMASSHNEVMVSGGIDLHAFTERVRVPHRKDAEQMLARLEERGRIGRIVKTSEELPTTSGKAKEKRWSVVLVSRPDLAKEAKLLYGD